MANTNDIARELTFGVEIETHVPTGAAGIIGAYKRGLPCSWLPGWTVERDGSIRVPDEYTRQRCEFVSPVLKGAAGIANVKSAVTEIKARGARVNDSCGVHVTVGFAGDAAALARLVTLFANFERALYATTGTKRREAGRWAKSLKQYGNAKSASERAGSDRYHGLNLVHMSYGGNRVEFRIFSGSLNAIKLAAWIQICLGLVERALLGTRAPKWDGKDNGNATNSKRAGAGEGEREVQRLFYALGWTKGRSDGIPRGVISDAVSLTSMKEAMIEMAKAYDAEPAGAF